MSSLQDRVEAPQHSSELASSRRPPTHTQWQRDREGHVGNGRYTITEVAGRLGVTPKTIMRWEKAGKVRRARRDWRGWRSYSLTDFRELKGYLESEAVTS